MSAVKQKSAQFVLEKRAKEIKAKLRENRIKLEGPTQRTTFEDQEETCLDLKKRLGQMTMISDSALLADVQKFLVDTRISIQQVEDPNLKALIVSNFMAMRGASTFKNLLQRFGGRVELLRELTWILLLIFGAASPVQCEQIATEGGFMLFYGQLLQFRDPELVENVVWGLANLISENASLIKMVGHSGLLDHINSEIQNALNQASFEDHARGKPLDIVAAYNLFILCLFKQDTSLRLEEQREIIGFLLYTVMGRFQQTFHTNKHLFKEFLEVLCNTLEYARGSRDQFQEFFSGHPQFDLLMNEILKIVTQELFYVNSNDLWHQAGALLDLLIGKLDHTFIHRLLQGGLIQGLQNILLTRQKMATQATKIMLTILNKEVPWDQGVLGLNNADADDLINGLLGCMSAWEGSETVQINILDIFCVLLEQQHKDFEGLCMVKPEIFQPVYRLFESEQSVALTLKALDLLLLMVRLSDDSEIDDFPCREYIAQNEHMVTQFLLEDHIDTRISRLTHQLGNMLQ